PRSQLARARVQRLQVAAFPELVLEGVRIARGPLHLEHLEEDLPPGPQRQRREQYQHCLNDHRCVRDQRNEREIGMYVQRRLSNRSWTRPGIPVGRGLVRARHASTTVARVRTSLPRSTSCAATIRARRSSESTTVASSSSPRRAGRLKSISTRWTT